MKKERKELEQEYENLKLLASFHEAYGVPENEKEREALINDIDRKSTRLNSSHRT